MNTTEPDAMKERGLHRIRGGGIGGIRTPPPRLSPASATPGTSRVRCAGSGRPRSMLAAAHRPSRRPVVRLRTHESHIVRPHFAPGLTPLADCQPDDGSGATACPLYRDPLRLGAARRDWPFLGQTNRSDMVTPHVFGGSVDARHLESAFLIFCSRCRTLTRNALHDAADGQCPKVMSDSENVLTPQPRRPGSRTPRQAHPRATRRGSRRRRACPRRAGRVRCGFPPHAR
jgi:hypothetical protein